MAKTEEGDVKETLAKRLRIFGDDVVQFNPVQMGYGRRVVDTILCFKGQYIVIEVKKNPAEELRRAQLYFLSIVVKAGGKAFIIDNQRDAAVFDPNASGLTYDEIILRSVAQAGDLSDARSGPDSLQRFDSEGDR
jgi:hypothetical protein